MTRLLFVYGSLMPGQGNDAARRLSQHADQLGRAYVHGHLIDVKGFPGLVSGKTGRVDGALLLVRTESLWADLDSYEEVGKSGGYRRELVVAIDKHQEPRSAWAYTVAPQA